MVVALVRVIRLFDDVHAYVKFPNMVVALVRVIRLSCLIYRVHAYVNFLLW